MLTGIVVITVKAFTIQDFLQLNSLSVCLLVDVLSSFWVLMIIQNLFYLSFASGTSSDVLLALCLCFYLWKCQTGFVRTDNLIQTLMKYSINTSLLVAWAIVSLFSHQIYWVQIFRLDALAGLITYIVMPHNFIFLGKSTQTSAEEDFWYFCEAFYLLSSKRESKFFSSWSLLVYPRIWKKSTSIRTSLCELVPVRLMRWSLILFVCYISLNARKSLREDLEEPVQLSQISGPSIGKFFHHSKSSRQTVDKVLWILFYLVALAHRRF